MQAIKSECQLVSLNVLTPTLPQAETMSECKSRKRPREDETDIGALMSVIAEVNKTVGQLLANIDLLQKQVERQERKLQQLEMQIVRNNLPDE